MSRIVLPLVALLLGAAGCGGGTDGTPVAPVTAPAPTPPPTAPAPPAPPMTVTGTVRAAAGPTALVAGAVVRARNLGTRAVDGETTTEMDGSYAIEELRGDRYSIEVVSPSGYLSAAPVLVNRPESGDLDLSADFSLLYYTLPEGTVTTLPAGRLIYKPANLFDLEGKTLTFTPDGDGYTVAVDSLSWEEPGPAAATHQLRDKQHQSAQVDLPFSFPFAGRTWNRVYANTNGHISFWRPERENHPQRDPWSNGTMRSLAAAIDSRSAAGLEAMIAALGAYYDDVTLSVDSTPARAVFSYSAIRPMPGYDFHAPLGPNVFQARLYPSGRIELAYRAVAERDGFVGLFHGLKNHGRTLDAVDDAVGDVAEPVVDITDLELVDTGSTLLFRMTLAADVPEQVDDGVIAYRIFPRFGEYDCWLQLAVTASGREPINGCRPAPPSFGYRVRGSTVELFVSKTLFYGADRIEWDAGAVWWGPDQFDHILEVRTARMDRTDLDLGALAGMVHGNVFEVFHYPVIPKAMHRVTSYIYETVPANDEIAVLFTDFRIDDLFGHGPSTGAINTPIQGIGPGATRPAPGEDYGSDNLVVSMSPMFLGGANLWPETGVSAGRRFRNFAKGVTWIAHEATHRWLVSLRFRNPRSGQVESLSDDGIHWSQWLHAPPVYPVWPSFSGERYLEISIQSGGIWMDNGDGTFTRQDNNFPPLPNGLSALDLYAMGMIPPEEVPDTFILRPAEETFPVGTVRATKLPVRIEDVIAAMGPRVPAADASRKEFRLGVYLLHDGPTPRPDMVQKARGVSAAVAEYFFRATGGRMMVLPNPASAP